MTQAGSCVHRKHIHVRAMLICEQSGVHLAQGTCRTEKWLPCTGIELRPPRVQAVFGPLEVEPICCAASGPIPSFSTDGRVIRSELDYGHFFHYRKHRQFQADVDRHIKPKKTANVMATAVRS